MAKAKKENPIALETQEYEAKINEYQTYLKEHPIVKTEMVGKELHAEIEVQIKIMTVLPTWLLALKKLKESSEEAAKDIQTFGDVGINAAYKIMKGI
jgi:hypothetical protein